MDINLKELEELLAEKAQPGDDGFMTSREIGERLGLSEEATKKRLRLLGERGLLEVSKKPVKSPINGQMHKVWAYKIKFPVVGATDFGAEKEIE